MKKLTLTITYQNYLDTTEVETPVTEAEWNALYNGDVVKELGEVPDDFELNSKSPLFTLTDIN